MPMRLLASVDPVLDGQRLTFTRVGEDRYIDTETGSVWNIFGLAVSGPLAVPHSIRWTTPTRSGSPGRPFIRTPASPMWALEK